MLRMIAGGFTLISILAGLWAALLWWHASKVNVASSEPSASEEEPPDISDETGFQPDLNPASRLALLNSHAALGAAVSVAAQACATILGWVASG